MFIFHHERNNLYCQGLCFPIPQVSQVTKYQANLGKLNFKIVFNFRKYEVLHNTWYLSGEQILLSENHFPLQSEVK